MIGKGRFKISSAVLTVLVVATGSAGIIGLSLYTDGREDYLYSSREQVHILMNSWSLLERQMLNLLVEPLTSRDEEKWLYSLKTFDTRFRNFLNSSFVRELAREDRVFVRKLSDANRLWSRLRDKMKRSAPKLTECIDVNQPSALHNFEDETKIALSRGGLLYRLGYLSGKSGRENDYEQFAQMISDYRGMLPTSQVYCTVLLEEISNIVSDRIVRQTTHLRLVVFVLSMIIAVSMVFFLAQIQGKYHLRRAELKQLISRRTNEPGAEKKTFSKQSTMSMRI
jgi:hypothetical protein